MKQLLTVLLSSLGLAGFANSAALSEHQFTEKFVQAFRLADPDSIVSIKRDLELVVKNLQGKETFFFLNNAYSKYLVEPNTFDEVIRDYVSSFVAGMRRDAVAIDRDRIVPIIKDRNWIPETQKSLDERGHKATEYIYEDFNDELVIVYAEDNPNNIKYFPLADLEAIGLRANQLRTLAIENLRKLLPKAEISEGSLASMIAVGGYYEASLLLFDDLWSALPKTNGEIVVAVPARDLLLFTGSLNEAGIAKLRELAVKYARESPYHVTDALFVYRNGKFVRYE